MVDFNRLHVSTLHAGHLQAFTQMSPISAMYAGIPSCYMDNIPKDTSNKCAI